MSRLRWGSLSLTPPYGNPGTGEVGAVQESRNR